MKMVVAGGGQRPKRRCQYDKKRKGMTATSVSMSKTKACNEEDDTTVHGAEVEDKGINDPIAICSHFFLITPLPNLQNYRSALGFLTTPHSFINVPPLSLK